MGKANLGLDLGTNSIGWAVVQQNVNGNYENLIGLGSRIIPMSQDILGEFEKGNSVSQTAARTGYRGVRRLHERNLLRRERLHRVLNVLGFLPKHFAEKLDKHGKFLKGTEIKLPYSHFNEVTQKWDFIFKKSYLEMVEDFKKNQSKLFFTKQNGKESKIPYDWTIYYLRKKALTQKIEKEELAWLLLHFNQKRGYYQLRGEDEVKNENKIEEFYNLKIVDVIEADKGKRDNEIWYNVILENGWVYRRSSRIPLFDWIGKNRDFIVTTEVNDDGQIKTDKDGKEKRSFRAPQENDWNLIKKKTENDISISKKYVGEFIYDSLLRKPDQKIRGKLVRTIERNFYKEELRKIITTQINFHKELQDRTLYQKCCNVLYENNDTHKKSIAEKDFNYLLVDDILFYQRPLKSKKNEISDCSLEYRKFKLNGDIKVERLKCISKSHPLFQEFRIWQWLSNLKIYERQQSEDIDITSQFLNSENDLENLFIFLNERKEIDQISLLKYLLDPLKLKGKILNEKIASLRWNYIDDNEKSYPCNETHHQIINRLRKIDNVPDNFANQENEIKLWHILYSVRDKNDIIKALRTFIVKYNNDNNTEINVEQFVENFKKYPLIKSEYGSYSEKAIKKLLPLLRLGKYWKSNEIHSDTRLRIDKLLTGEFDETIKDRVRNKTLKLTEIDHFKGLPIWLASYIIYDKHSETNETERWNSPEDLDKYLKHFKQHSLRNPIVEQIITETLRVVKDIWIKFGEGKKDFFNEIRLELGRDMKNNAADRKAISDINIQNENTNLRIRAILAELKNLGVENVIPYSPYQQEALKIYEDGVLKSGIEIPEDIIKISKSNAPGSKDILKYKLWLEQKYQSPYTGAIIPLNKLFTTAYEIEHIIPQSIYFDDSFSNKVICESEVNKAKDNMFGLEYIKNPGQQIISLNGGGSVKIFNEEEYKDFIKTNYSNNKSKARKLLLEEVPEKMIERQLNDTRYISKIVKNILSKLVRSEQNDDGVTSKNVLSTNGTITSVLKQDWGLNDIWNELMLPRFERLNALTNTSHFTAFNNKYQKYLPTVPDELRKGFQLKRIDHRHHALDALVIACTTRNHINYLNNQTALDKNKKKDEKQNARFDLKAKLCFKTKPDDKGNYRWQFKKPWETITEDTKDKLEKTIVSFKQNIRVINKTVNYFQKIVDGKKEFVKQIKGENWAIRKPLHTPMPFGKKEYGFNLLKISDNIGKKDFIIDNRIKLKIDNLLLNNENAIGKVKEILKKEPLLDENNNPILETTFKIKNIKFRKRKPIFDLANRSSQGGITNLEQMQKIINKVADFQLRQELLNHLKENNFDIDLAFGLEGIEKFNKKRKIPIYKLPIAESSDKKFLLGNSIGNNKKYVEAETGTNLYFAIYLDLKGNRNFETIPLNIVIERLKQGLTPVPEKENHDLLFWLSPNDFVYIPSDEEKESKLIIDFDNLSPEHYKRIYKFVSCTGSEGHFVPQYYSKDVFKNEMGTNNKSERPISNLGFNKNMMIKDQCVKIKVDRLGHISRSNL